MLNKKNQKKKKTDQLFVVYSRGVKLIRDHLYIQMQIIVMLN